jgi:L-asparaginase II
MGRRALLRQGNLRRGALYFECSGKHGGIVRLSYEMLETLNDVIEDDGEGAGSPG